MTSLAQQSNGLEPTEGFFDPLAPPLAQRVAGVAAGTPVESVSEILCSGAIQ